MGRNIFKKLISCVTLAAFVFTSVPVSFAQTMTAVGMMPQPGTMVSLTSAFTPAQLKGMVIHPDDPFKFDFLVYRGDQPVSSDDKQAEYTKLIKYFLAALAVPDTDQWVNLSPYEKDRIIPDNFGLTEMGRDLLAQDYLLKQISASLTNPDSELGKKFWDGVYSKAYEKFGTTDVPTDTFNKVWIVPDKAVVYEKGNTVVILEHHLKVMMETDYLASSRGPIGAEGSQSSAIPRLFEARNDDAVEISKQVMREVIIPAIEKEVNEGKNFAPLRQVYSGMLLSCWYKLVLKQSLLSKVYADKGKVRGVDQDPKTNQEIWGQYVQAFKKGVFNMIKEDADRLSGEVIPRKYFSGGTKADSAEMIQRLQGPDAAAKAAGVAEAEGMELVAAKMDAQGVAVDPTVSLRRTNDAAMDARQAYIFADELPAGTADALLKEGVISSISRGGVYKIESYELPDSIRAAFDNGVSRDKPEAVSNQILRALQSAQVPDGGVISTLGNGVLVNSTLHARQQLSGFLSKPSAIPLTDKEITRLSRKIAKELGLSDMKALPRSGLIAYNLSGSGFRYRFDLLIYAKEADAPFVMSFDLVEEWAKGLALAMRDNNIMAAFISSMKDIFMKSRGWEDFYHEQFINKPFDGIYAMYMADEGRNGEYDHSRSNGLVRAAVARDLKVAPLMDEQAKMPGALGPGSYKNITGGKITRMPDQADLNKDMIAITRNGKTEKTSSVNRWDMIIVDGDGAYSVEQGVSTYIGQYNETGDKIKRLDRSLTFEKSEILKAIGNDQEALQELIKNGYVYSPKDDTTGRMRIAIVPSNKFALLGFGLDNKKINALLALQPERFFWKGRRSSSFQDVTIAPLIETNEQGLNEIVTHPFVTDSTGLNRVMALLAEQNLIKERKKLESDKLWNKGQEELRKRQEALALQGAAAEAKNKAGQPAQGLVTQEVSEKPAARTRQRLFKRQMGMGRKNFNEAQNVDDAQAVNVLPGPYDLQKAFEAFLEEAAPGKKPSSERVTEIQERLRFLNDALPGLAEEKDPDKIMARLFPSEFGPVTRGLIEVSSLIRDSINYEDPYDPQKNPDLLFPFDYGISKGLVFKIGPNLYICPTTESFRRHFIFQMDNEGNILWKREFMIQGDLPNKMDLGVEKRPEIERLINGMFPKAEYSARVSFARKYPSGTLALYGKPLAAPVEIVVYDDARDGHRLMHVSREMLVQWAGDMGLSVDALAKKIWLKTMECFLASKETGYSAFADGHIENYRVSPVYNKESGALEDVAVQLVGDFKGYFPTLLSHPATRITVGALVAMAVAGTTINYSQGNASAYDLFISPILGYLGVTIGVTVPFDYVLFLGSLEWQRRAWSGEEGIDLGFSDIVNLIPEARANIAKERSKERVSRASWIQDLSARLFGRLGNALTDILTRLMVDESTGPAVSVMATADHAQQGGIDMNSAGLDMQIKRDGNGVVLPVSQQDLENIHIEGLVPIILNIQPAANVSLFSDTAAAGSA